jgi:hypothetical protein
LWIHQALLESGRLTPEQEQDVRRFRRRELTRALKRQLGRLSRGDRNLRPFAAYLGHRLRGG